MPLPEPKLIYCQFYPKEYIWEIKFKIEKFQFKKAHMEFCLQNVTLTEFWKIHIWNYKNITYPRS